jgi:two-component system, response regulator
MPEETNMLIIEEMDESVVNVTLLNLAAEGSGGIAALRELIINDPSASVALLIPEDMNDPDVIIEAVKAGAKAYIKKPLSGEEMNKMPDRKAWQEGRTMTAPRTINILMVEDTEEHAVLLRRSLEKGNLKSRLAWVTDGNAALDFLHHRGAYTDRQANPRPDLIFLDLKLPKISGLEVLEQIKSEAGLRDIPVTVLTVSDEGGDIIRSFQGGAESFFTKSALFLNQGAGSTAILDTVIAMAGV